MKVKPGEGKCRVMDFSTIRKRMRAVRRGFMEWPTIKVKNPEKYLHSSRKK